MQQRVETLTDHLQILCYIHRSSQAKTNTAWWMKHKLCIKQAWAENVKCDPTQRGVFFTYSEQTHWFCWRKIPWKWKWHWNSLTSLRLLNFSTPFDYRGLITPVLSWGTFTCWGSTSTACSRVFPSWLQPGHRDANTDLRPTGRIYTRHLTIEPFSCPASS